MAENNTYDIDAFVAKATSIKDKMPKLPSGDINRFKLEDGMSAFVVPLPAVRGACERGGTYLVSHAINTRRFEKGSFFTSCGHLSDERCLPCDVLEMYIKLSRLNKIPEEDKVFWRDVAECMVPSKIWYFPVLLLATMDAQGNQTNGNINTVFLLSITSESFMKSYVGKVNELGIAKMDNLRIIKVSRTGKASIAEIPTDEKVSKKKIVLPSGILEKVPKIDSWIKPRPVDMTVKKMIDYGILTADSTPENWELCFSSKVVVAPEQEVVPDPEPSKAEEISDPTGIDLEDLPF
jgi:hypothetical protein